MQMVCTTVSSSLKADFVRGLDANAILYKQIDFVQVVLD
ncbi:hypothetical protein RintRC_6394 [Richelia intracellularis]|nr:hypothetical protein RintRC_6394 [Richelia intracellularis]